MIELTELQLEVGFQIPAIPERVSVVFTPGQAMLLEKLADAYGVGVSSVLRAIMEDVTAKVARDGLKLHK